MKKYVALSLAMMFGLGITCTASAASKDEMAAELKTLGARLIELEKLDKSIKTEKIAKQASIENKLNFDGSEIRLRWIKNNATDGDGVMSNRVRLKTNYKVDKQITVNTRWEVMSENELGATGKSDRYKLLDANAIIKDVLDTTMTVGRFGQSFGATSYWNSGSYGGIDGVKTSFGNKVKMTMGFANFTPVNSQLADATFMNASYDLNKDVTVVGMWVKEKTGADSNYDVRGLGLQVDLNDEFKFRGDYTKNYKSGTGIAGTKPTGYYMNLKWQDAKANNPGSYALTLLYRNIKYGNMFGTIGTSSSIPLQDSTLKVGLKGLGISFDYAIAKDVMLSGYQTFNTSNADTGAKLGNYSRLQTTIGF